MVTDRNHITDAQIGMVVRGFIQVWMRVEDTLAKELADSGDERAEKDARMTAVHETLFRIGSNLVGCGRMSMGELSAALSVPLSTATRLVDVLVGAGYVQRVNDPADRRVVLVEFTARGREIYDIMGKHVTERIRNIAANLREDELQTLLTLLNKVTLAVQENTK